MLNFVIKIWRFKSPKLNERKSITIPVKPEHVQMQATTKTEARLVGSSNATMTRPKSLDFFMNEQAYRQR